MERVNTICCNEEMIELVVYNNSFNSEMDTIRFICGVCGKLIDINDYSLDDEELSSLLENEEELLKDTKIYKEMMNEEIIDELDK